MKNKAERLITSSIKSPKCFALKEVKEVKEGGVGGKEGKKGGLMVLVGEGLGGCLCASYPPYAPLLVKF